MNEYLLGNIEKIGFRRLEKKKFDKDYPLIETMRYGGGICVVQCFSQMEQWVIEVIFQN